MTTQLPPAALQRVDVEIPATTSRPEKRFQLLASSESLLGIQAALRVLGQELTIPISQPGTGVYAATIGDQVYYFDSPEFLRGVMAIFSQADIDYNTTITNIVRDPNSTKIPQLMQFVG